VWRAVAVFGMAAVFVVSIPAAAWAHATLESTDPPDGSHIPTAPSTVTLNFDENVSGSLDAVRVLDAAGHRVDNGSTQFSGHSVVATLRKGLPLGGYIVAWRVVSADSHVVSSAFTFVVGNGAAPSRNAIARAAGRGSDHWYQVVGVLARWLGFAGSLVVLGAAVLFAFTDAADPVFGIAVGLVLIAGVAAIIGRIAELLPRAALATGLGASALFHPGVMSKLLGKGVGFGYLLLIAGIAAVIASMQVRRSDTSQACGVAGASLIALSFVTSGHPTTASPKWLAMAADLVHVSAAGVWLGGLVALAVLWHPLRREAGRDADARLAIAFSRLATVALVSLAIAGAALAWTQVGSVHALLHTSYGQVLLVKVAFVGLVAYLGAHNRFRVLPVAAPIEESIEVTVGAPLHEDARSDLAERQEGSWRQLGRVVRAEAVLLVMVVGLSAVLVNLTPARTSAAGPQIARETFGKGSVELIVEPAKRGRNAIHLALYNDIGQLADLAPGGITLTLSLPAANINGLAVTPIKLGPGHYLAATDAFTVPGTWRVHVQGVASEFQDLTADTQIKIAS
jgi:copper transport protein